MKEKAGFIVYRDYEEQINLLSDEDAGQLFKAMFAYENREEEIPLSPFAKLAFSFMRKDMDRNRDKYEDKCQRNRENGAKGGRPKKMEEEKPSGFSENQKKPNGFLENPKEPGEVFENPTNTNTDTDTNTDTERAFPPNPPKGSARNGFHRFWEEYPRKAAPEDAKAAWDELGLDDSTQRQIMEALRQAKESTQWREENGRYIPKAAKWLRERQWCNVIPLCPKTYDLEELESISVFDLPDEMLR